MLTSFEAGEVGESVTLFYIQFQNKKKLFTFYAKLIWLHKQSRIESLIW